MDFIDIGIDPLNPVQVRARNMERERVKSEFGKRISFWGGVDTQHLLPYGTPERVRDEVRRLFRSEGVGSSGHWPSSGSHPDSPLATRH